MATQTALITFLTFLTLLRANLRAILLLSTTVVGLIINLGLGLPLAESLLFGVII